ncbi:Uncharacterised protein [Providencia rustigianii]|uniref:Lipoprotein n=1 Tax=Providencia rustigianii TaxID=158850 RepID=A0A379G835_9GAMM|nr:MULTISPECIES: hypothetical protein [Providencia]SPY79083.1 Uncharacterised protein [Providencia rustigianii]SUC37056.1 Uncharacterised protein [Providencia rustigianii]VEB75835.1 Uncharacterised protein [Providencia rustigianii]VEH56894.1 Uncharacterised protein [Providencia rustigianii]
MIKRSLTLMTLLLAGCSTSLEYTKADLENNPDVGYSDSGYYRLVFKDKKVISVPENAHLVPGTDNNVVGKLNADNKTGEIVVAGLATKLNGNINSQVGGHDYNLSFLVTDENNLPISSINYLIFNDCNDEVYPGITNANGRTFSVSTQAECTLSLGIPE